MGGINALNLEMFDTKSRPVEALLHLKKTRSGHDILLCTKDPAPASAIRESRQTGLALFTVREVGLLRDVDLETVRAVVAVKREFPEADVLKCLREVAGQ